MNNTTIKRYYWDIRYLLPILLLITTTFSAQTTRYVKPLATGNGNGNSWLNASADLQDIINISSAGDQIWVAAGTYKPNRRGDNLFVITPNDPYNSFVLKEGVKIYGNFSGTETELSQRILPTFNETVSYSSILSGDFSNNDTVEGSGGTLLISNNEENAHHIVICVGSEAVPISNNTVLNGFTIKGSYHTNNSFGMLVNGVGINDGGGISNYYGSPAISNVLVTNNFTSNSGGGIYNFNSSSLISNAVISYNMGDDGGAGIYNDESSTSINNSFIINNRGFYLYSSTAGGGGICSRNSELTLTDVTVSGNMSSFGGGISNHNTDAVLTNVIISGNICTYGTTMGDGGGGMINVFSSPILNNVTITDNDADGYGGGIYNSNYSSPILNNVTISNNTSTDGGGGMCNYYYSEPELHEVAITGNSVSSGGGGGIFNTYFSSATITNTNIDNNQCIDARGGGIYNNDNCFVIFDGGSISGNQVGNISTGAAVYNYFALTSSYSNMSFENNDNIAIANYGCNDISFTNITVSNNSGTGIDNRSSSPVYDNVTIDGNTGWGMYNFEAATICNNITFNANTGGGIANYNCSPVFNDCVITGNTATQKGGGILNDNASPVFTNVSIRGNAAPTGAGIYNINSNPVFTNVLISGNNATLRGGGIYNDNSDPIFTNATICGNKGTNFNSGAMYNLNSFPVFRNSIIWGNSALTNSSPNSTPAYYYTLAQGITGTLINGNISGDINPLFTLDVSYTTAPFTNGDYTLQNISPLLNIGSNIYYDEGQTPNLSLITSDLAGNNRINETTIDLGAYEYTEACTTPAPDAQAQTFCNNATVSGLVAVGTALQWYDVEEGGTLLDPEVNLSSGTYYVTQTMDDCESPRLAVTITITNVSPPTGNQQQEISLNSSETATLANLVVDGTDIQWYLSETDIATNASVSIETTISNGSTYYATQTIDGCESLPLPVTVNIILGTNNINNSTLTYYPNPVNDLLYVKASIEIDAISVYNMIGQKIYEKNLGDLNAIINMSSFPDGNYILYIKSEEKTDSVLIIKTSHN